MCMNLGLPATNEAAGLNSTFLLVTCCFFTQADKTKIFNVLKTLFFPWIWRTAAHAAPDAWNSSAAQTHRQPPSLSHKLCLVQGKDHVALQRGKGWWEREVWGKWVGIGRLRFTFLSGIWYQDKVRPRLIHKTEQREEESYHCTYDMIYVR